MALTRRGQFNKIPIAVWGRGEPRDAAIRAGKPTASARACALANGFPLTDQADWSVEIRLSERDAGIATRYDPHVVAWSPVPWDPDA